MTNAPTDSQAQTTDVQTHAIERLTQEVERLNAHRFVALHNRPGRLLLFQFARGLAFGLGSVIGATILVSLLGWWLSQFEFIPVIGDWVSQIVDQISKGAGQ